ncbi:MAG: PAS domain S-box protein [Anaerolineaceae bacterium]|nr:PAS domain S-box protein [Anaerolineaceae bacterium]
MYTQDPLAQNMLPAQLEDKYITQQKILIEMGQRALNTADPCQLIRESIQLVAKALQADYCEMIRLTEQDELELIARLEGPLSSEDSAALAADITTQARLTLQAQQDIIVEDFNQDERFSAHTSDRPAAFTSGLSVLVPGREKPFGVLGVHTLDRVIFSTADLNFLRKIANIYALAIDRQRIEHSLRVSQEELAFIQEGVSEGITIHGRDGRLVYANHKAAKLLGFASPEKLLASSVAEIRETFRTYNENGDVFPPEDLPANRVFSEETDSTVSAIMLFKILATGAQGWWKVSSTRLKNYSRPGEYALNFFQDISDLKNTERDQHFMAQVSHILASSLEEEEILNRITRLAAAYLTDWCVIHRLEENGEVYRLAIAHKDIETFKLMQKMSEIAPPNPEMNNGFHKIVRSEQEVFYPEITIDQLKTLTRNEESARFLHSSGVQSVIVLPLLARGHSQGTLTLAWTNPVSPAGSREIQLARELARRTAVTMDNLRLFQQTSDLNAALEDKVARRTQELEKTVSNLHDEITERIQTEKLLERSRALFSDLFNLSPDAILLVNQAGEIMRINDQGQKLFGYQREELIGKEVDMLLPEQFRKPYLRQRRAFQKNPARRTIGQNFELYGRNKHGQEFPVDVTLSPVKIEKEWLVISVIRDITDQKRIQAELAEVQHRLMDQQEADRLMIAQELHDNSVQELFSLTFQLSELESDLALAGETALSERVTAVSENVQRVIQGLRNLSRDLRPPALAPFGLEQAIYSHIERFQEFHPLITIHANLTPDGQQLEERLRLVLFRIYQTAVSNVARHAEAGQLWVRLALNEQELIMDIKDDGKGFTVPERWIELARQGHLGLVGIQERVDAVGGKLVVVSSPGTGTLVRVTVPLVHTDPV